MTSRKRHVLSPSTIKTLRERKTSHTLKQLATELGYLESYSATLSGVLRGEDGRLAPESENALRARLGLTPIHRILTAPCPDCGNLHTGRCHGEPGTVAWVRLGERVAKARDAKPPKSLMGWKTYVLRQAIIYREAMEATWATGTTES